MQDYFCIQPTVCLEVQEIAQGFHIFVNGCVFLVFLKGAPNTWHKRTGGQILEHLFSLQVWDMRTKACIHTLTGHTSTVAVVKCQAVEPQVSKQTTCNTRNQICSLFQDSSIQSQLGIQCTVNSSILVSALAWGHHFTPNLA